MKYFDNISRSYLPNTTKVFITQSVPALFIILYVFLLFLCVFCCVYLVRTNHTFVCSHFSSFSTFPTQNYSGTFMASCFTTLWRFLFSFRHLPSFLFHIIFFASNLWVFCSWFQVSSAPMQVSLLAFSFWRQKISVDLKILSRSLRINFPCPVSNSVFFVVSCFSISILVPLRLLSIRQCLSVCQTISLLSFFF